LTYQGLASTNRPNLTYKEMNIPTSPYPQSKLIKGIRWLTEPILDNNVGDVWSNTWADDDNLYLVGDDTFLGDDPRGRNLSIYKGEGMPPEHKVTPINDMQEFLQAVVAPWWKGAGLACIDGVLYLGLYSQSNPNELSPSRLAHNADHSSIIKSTDYGQTWSGSPDEHLANPMFPGKEFSTPFFVQYGKNYSGAMDEYVYMCSNDGGWNNWNRMMLARVLRTKIGALDRRDWEFFMAADGQNRSTWTSDVDQSGSIFEHKLHTSMTGIHYVPALDRFLMPQWGYTDLNGENPLRQTYMHLYEAPKPWGPWALVHVEEDFGNAWYNPSFPAKWFEDGGLRMWLVSSGDYMAKRVANRPDYSFCVRKLEFVL